MSPPRQPRAQERRDQSRGAAGQCCSVRDTGAGRARGAVGSRSASNLQLPVHGGRRGHHIGERHPRPDLDALPVDRDTPVGQQPFDAGLRKTIRTLRGRMGGVARHEGHLDQRDIRGSPSVTLFERYSQWPHDLAVQDARTVVDLFLPNLTRPSNPLAGMNAWRGRLSSRPGGGANARRTTARSAAFSDRSHGFRPAGGTSLVASRRPAGPDQGPSRRRRLRLWRRGCSPAAGANKTSRRASPIERANRDETSRAPATWVWLGGGAP